MRRPVRADVGRPGGAGSGLSAPTEDGADSRVSAATGHGADSRVSAATRGLLREAWAALGGPPDLVELVEFTGRGHGLLPSSLAALPAMLAAVGAATLAASELDAARRGDQPSAVSVDIEHVAVAARSERYAREESE